MTRVTPPEKFFGHEMGEERKIARWDRIVEYFYRLESESDVLQVRDMGETTEGNPFLLVIISSADNLRDLEHFRKVNNQISDPRGLTEEAIEELVREGRAVVCQSMSLHATEIGGTQMAPELAFDLLTDDSEEVERILDNVIFLMVPCFNPDGQLMVADWYEQYAGTEFEGCPLPWLYHKYAGHDNNRDAFMLNLVESSYMGEILFRQWRPQAYQDHHHMGSYGARFYVAPYCDPIRPHADPLIWREQAWYGAHMAYKLEQSGRQGILNAAQFPGWGHLGFHWITAYHNTAGMLTESANAKLASPKYIHSDQLEGASPKTMPDYAPQVNFPNPWMGGWWTLKDIVEQKKISSLALLDLCARNKETVLYNAYLKAKNQTERGRQSGPRAYVIESAGHDPLTTHKLVKLLCNQGIEVKRSDGEFTADGRAYPAGTYVVFLAQPKMGLVRTLLGRTVYPNTHWSYNPDGTPTVFDTASDTVAEYMGVQVQPVDECPDGQFVPVGMPRRPEGKVCSSDCGYVLDPRLNDSFAAVSRLLDAGAEVRRLSSPVEVDGDMLPAGAFWIEPDGVKPNITEKIARELGLTFMGSSSAAQCPSAIVRRRRVGIYQRFWGGNADEGWTRFIFDEWGIPYTTITDADVQDADSLSDQIDVLILPSDPVHMLVDIENVDSSRAKRKAYTDSMPPEYHSGMGEDGLKSLGKFVRAGGRLVAFDAAWAAAARACDLKVENVVEDAGPKEFFTHGSTLRCEVDVSHPVALGMPEEALVFSWDSATFSIVEGMHAERYRVVARYPQSNILQSGRLIGESRIAGRAALLSIDVERGDVVLFGFRPQHRAQTHGTYKFLFNCIF